MAIRAGGDLGVSFDALIGSVQAVRASVEAMRSDLAAQVPSVAEIAGTLTVPASTNGVVQLFPSSPPAGTMWHVKSVRVLSAGGAQDSPTGTAYLYVGSAPPTVGATTGADNAAGWRDVTTLAFPQRGFFEDWECVVVNPSQLYVVITGGTPADVLLVTATCKQVKIANT